MGDRMGDGDKHAVDVMSTEQTSQIYLTPPSLPRPTVFLRITPIVVRAGMRLHDPSYVPPADAVVSCSSNCDGSIGRVSSICMREAHDTHGESIKAGAHVQINEMSLWLMESLRRC